MSNIIITDEQTEETQEEPTKKITYPATEDDEERFFLMYHMNMQPSEVERIKPDYRQWLIARFIAQKNAEQEAMERHHLLRQLGPNLKT